MARNKRILLYNQSLTGTGHFVKTYEIARALAPSHEVCLVDGGRPIPRRPIADPVTVLSLPRIYRLAGRLAPVDAGQGISAVMEERRHILLDSVERMRPDAVVIDHFPFYKWELHDEIVALIRRAREAHPGVKVICSTWELPRGDDACPRAPAPELVLQAFREHFDALLIHADPSFISLEEFLPWANQIAAPTIYTGYICEKLDDVKSPCERHFASDTGLVVVSTGGACLPELLRASVGAWKKLIAAGATGGRTMLAFGPPFGEQDRVDGQQPPAANVHVRLEPFSPDFLRALTRAELSISQAGYNTCANIFASRVRAILVPNPASLDQTIRATRMAERGLAWMIDAADLSADRLAAAILEALASAPPVHDLDLSGADATRQIIEELCELGPHHRSVMELAGTRIRS